MRLTDDLKEELFPDNVVLLGYRGSIAHNMFIPDSDPNSIDDVDLMSIYMAPVDQYIGIKKIKDVSEKFVDRWDVVNYEFMKFVHLLMKSNPNVMSMLWLRDNHYINIHEYGKVLIENRDLFVSKQAYHSYIGYAYSQLKGITRCNYEGYMGSKRKALVDKFKYDTKNASHCIRLLKQGIELLTEGRVNVFREDAPLLLEIKRGEWTLEKVKVEADRLFKLVDEAYIRSSLPFTPDLDKINVIVKDIMLDYLNKGAI